MALNGDKNKAAKLYYNIHMVIMLKGVVKSVIGQKNSRRKMITLELNGDIGEGSVRVSTIRNFRVGEQAVIKIKISDHLEEIG